VTPGELHSDEEIFSRCAIDEGSGYIGHASSIHVRHELHRTLNVAAAPFSVTCSGAAGIVDGDVGATHLVAVPTDHGTLPGPAGLSSDARSITLDQGDPRFRRSRIDVDASKSREFFGELLLDLVVHWS